MILSSSNLALVKAWQVPKISYIENPVTDNNNLVDSDDVTITVKSPQQEAWPDLAVYPNDISFSDFSPISGETITIRASIHNLGLIPATGIKVKVFRGIPEDGLQIGSDQIIDSLTVNESKSIEVDLDTTGLAGTYDIYVTIDPDNSIAESNEGNNRASKILMINTHPEANANGPYEGYEGSAINFDATNSYDPDSNPLLYRWDFDNDATWDTSWLDLDKEKASHTWPDDYTGTVRLEVYDGRLTDTTTTTVTVHNVAPSVDAGQDKVVNEGDTVSFTGSFNDPGLKDTHTTAWDFGDGGLQVTGTLTPAHVYQDNGVYTVTLTVTDDDDESGTDSFTVTVNNLPPTVGEIIVSSDLIQLDTHITASAEFTDPGLYDTHLAVWDWGDGDRTSGIVEETSGSGTVEGSHIYTTAGTYTIKLTITDKDGDSDFSIYEYIIVKHPPVADAWVNIQINSEDQAETIIYGTASDEDNDPLEYRWLEGETEIQTWQPVGANGEAHLNLANLAYFDLGDHTLTLEVSDALSVASDEMILTITNSPPTVAPSGGGTYQIHDDITLGGAVSDFDGDLLNYEWIEGETVYFSGSIESLFGGEPVALPAHIITGGLPLGNHSLILRVNDGVNPSVEQGINIEAIDITKPTLAPVSDTSILWPPNHKLVDITIQAKAWDNSGSVTLSAVIVSSEPPDTDGDGNTIPDFYGLYIDQENGIITCQLRAERSGKGDGRTYTITITATDSSGNTSSAEVKILAPHDKRKQ